MCDQSMCRELFDRGHRPCAIYHTPSIQYLSVAVISQDAEVPFLSFGRRTRSWTSRCNPLFTSSNLASVTMLPSKMALTPRNSPASSAAWIQLAAGRNTDEPLRYHRTTLFFVVGGFRCWVLGFGAECEAPRYYGRRRVLSLVLGNHSGQR
jgi:hypothetical protein